MATIREWLSAVNFNWAQGDIVYQWNKEYPDNPGHEPDCAEMIDHKHPIMDKEFEDRFGVCEAPRIIARDNGRIHFISLYDGATKLETIHTAPRKYLDPDKNPIEPRGGGGE